LERVPRRSRLRVSPLMVVLPVIRCFIRFPFAIRFPLACP
jgi:hypothetical protein